MIRRPRQGNEGTAQLAERLGCKLVEAVPRHGHARPALVGCDPVLSERMKALGARWDSFNHALAFAGWPALQAALRYALEQQAGNRAQQAGSCTQQAGSCAQQGGARADAAAPQERQGPGHAAG
jgi:hypothetical protein